MASDISSIFQQELINTFESLLSVTVAIDKVEISSVDDIDSNQVLKIDLELKDSDKSYIISFIMPTLISAKFEFFMLGGISEIKSVIDDEITDALKEIISTVGGSLSTAINAQNYPDFDNISSSVIDTKSISKDEIDLDSIYKIILNIKDEELDFYIYFDENFLPFVEKLVSGEKIQTQSTDEIMQGGESVEPGGGGSSILSMLGSEAGENLKLLLDTKLKLSVRLGNKTFLLKDIINWDIGHIVELDQMVNEPLDILVNNIKVGEGEAVVVEGKFGVKVKFMGEEREEVENG